MLQWLRLHTPNEGGMGSISVLKHLKEQKVFFKLSEEDFFSPNLEPRPRQKKFPHSLYLPKRVSGSTFSMYILQSDLFLSSGFHPYQAVDFNNFNGKLSFVTIILFTSVQ